MNFQTRSNSANPIDLRYCCAVWLTCLGAINGCDMRNKSHFFPKGKPLPPTIYVTLEGDREFAFGKPMPLTISLQNIDRKPIWIDANHLPWSYYYGLRVQLDNEFVEASLPIGDPRPNNVKSLQPGEKLNGTLDLAEWLHVRKASTNVERVTVGIRLSLLAANSDPQLTGDLQWYTADLPDVTVVLHAGVTGP